MANRHAAPHRKRKSKRKERPLLGTALVLCFCTLAFVFAGFLWQEALRTSTQVPERQTGSDDDFRPQVGRKGSRGRKRCYRRDGLCIAPMAGAGLQLYPAADAGKL